MVGPSFPCVEPPNEESSSQQNVRDAKVLTKVICCLFKGIPTMTLFLQALMANIARAFEHLTICPTGRSLIK
jgi:hypothetical protein